MGWFLIIGCFIVFVAVMANKRTKHDSIYDGSISGTDNDNDSDIDNTVSVTIKGVDPQTDNEFLFYDFVMYQPKVLLEKWYEKAILLDWKFKPQYEAAIKQKIETGSFTNPHSFLEYFNNEFDFVAIDFETANEKRISACAIGLAFVKDDKFVYTTYHYIKPPDTEKFNNINVSLHGITQKDVEYMSTFDELWERELKQYFNKQLIVFHNSSMDLSILKQLFEFYSIKNYSIKYVDTMRIAANAGLPKKLTDLAKHFSIEIEKLHDPEEDAKLCAQVFSELSSSNDYKNLIEELRYNKQGHIVKNKTAFYTDYEKLSGDVLSKDLTHANPNNPFYNKKVVFTGTLDGMSREDAAQKIRVMGADINTAISKRTNFVVMGKNAGPAKMEKIELLNNSGANIVILREHEFINMI
jgi:DNA polymerase-3 subunit epsilon